MMDSRRRDEPSFDIEEIEPLNEDDGISDLRLSDLEDHDSGKKRRILIISAGLLIIFLVMLVATKSLNNGEEESADKGYLLPPEPSTLSGEAPPLPDGTLADKSGFEDVKPESNDTAPMADAKPDEREEFSKIIEDLKQKEENASTAPQTEQPKSPDEVLSQKIEEMTAPKEQAKEEKKAEPLKVATEPQTLDKAPQMPSVSKGVKGGMFYVQVGATSKPNPDPSFLSVLQQNNLRYTMLAIDVGGNRVNKILIGPYKTKDAALKDLPTIRRYVTKDAFVYTAQ